MKKIKLQDIKASIEENDYINYLLYLNNMSTITKKTFAIIFRQCRKYKHMRYIIVLLDKLQYLNCSIFNIFTGEYIVSTYYFCTDSVTYYREYKTSIYLQYIKYIDIITNNENINIDISHPFETLSIMLHKDNKFKKSELHPLIDKEKLYENEMIYIMRDFIIMRSKSLSIRYCFWDGCYDIIMNIASILNENIENENEKNKHSITYFYNRMIYCMQSL